jgi:hypothetical protein
MALLLVAACGRNEAARPEWRAEVERNCLRSGQVRITQNVMRMSPINPGGYCGADHPLRVAAFDRTNIRTNRPLPMTCPMVAAVDRWLDEVVQPAAVTQFGSPVVEIETHGSYNCRRIMNRRFGPMSEHAFANAIDVAGFRLADGRRIRVGRATAPGLPSPWRFLEERSLGVSMAQGGLDLITIGPGIDGAQPPEINFGSNDTRAFWRKVRDGACGKFSTVLGPGSEDGAHEEHLHLDLARHGRNGNRRVCR